MNSNLETFPHIYNMYDFDTCIKDMFITNKLFCTFTSPEGIEELVGEITTRYDIMYNKIFALFVKSNNEYVLTYNVEPGNISSIPENTILVHRKKDTNTLYTINALNELIKKLNGGVVNTDYRVNWQHYKNCILLTQNNELKQLNTKIYKIFEI